MKLIVFVALLLAISSCSDIQETDELIPHKCDAAVRKLGASGVSLYSDFTGKFNFFRFLQDSINVIADFKQVEVSCEGYYVDVARTLIIAAVPAQYRECTADILDGVDGLYEMIVTIITDSSDWYPITKSVLVVIDEITEAVYSCMNPGQTISYPAFTQNNKFIQECALVVAEQALPQAQKLYAGELALDMNLMFQLMPLINDIKLKCVEPIQESF